LPENICCQVEKAFDRLENLRQCNLPCEEMTANLIAELSLALSELQTSTIEVLEQDEALTSSRLALEEERSRYQDLFEFAPDSYLVTDTESIILEANSSASNLFNVNKSYLIGKPLALFVHEEDRSSFRTRLVQLKNGTLIQNGDWELIMLSSKGVAFPSSITVEKVTVSREKSTELRWLLRDITKRRQQEKELQKVDKLESLGILAGGIAHDLNNFLTVILGNLSLLKMYTREDNKAFRYLQDMEKAIKQTRNLTRQLLTFAKGGQPLTKAVSICSLIKEVSAFALSGSKASCEFLLSEDLPSVEIDIGQITQVISNLLINADQAMQTGGKIKVCAEKLAVTEENDILPLRIGNYVALSITDEGVGISKQHLPKIFDPYFTTKDQGNGLGMTVCYSILKKHGGYISVHSVEWEGTTFTVYLPVSSNKANQESVDNTLLLGEGKILFMDDDESIRQTAGEMLTFLGYQVEFARNGDEAVKLYKEAWNLGTPFNVVITDLTVRGGTGGKTAIRELLKSDPNVKAIVSSGYSYDSLLSDYSKYGFCGVIQKPYRLQELGEVLSSVIREK